REALSSARYAAGDTEGALRVLLEGIDLTPGALALRNAAVLLCVRRRDFVQAERLAERPRLDALAHPTTFGLKGHAVSSLGRHREAAAAYREALKLAPGDVMIRRLASIADINPSAPRAPDNFIRGLFDDDAERFELHLLGLEYRIPDLLRRH